MNSVTVWLNNTTKYNQYNHKFEVKKQKQKKQKTKQNECFHLPIEIINVT